MEPCLQHPWQPTHACRQCGSTLCVLCAPGECAACRLPEEDVPPWEEHTAFVRMVGLALLAPRRTFGRLADGEVGHAWTFASLCCLAPRLLYALFDGRGGPLWMLLRASISAAVQAASAMFVLGSVHFLFTLCVARERARWRLSMRAAGYAQPITMVLGVLVASVMLALPGLREHAVLREGALLASATWYTLPLFWFGRDRLQLGTSLALAVALATNLAMLAALRALS